MPENQQVWFSGFFLLYHYILTPSLLHSDIIFTTFRHHFHFDLTSFWRRFYIIFISFIHHFGLAKKVYLPYQKGEFISLKGW